MGNRASSGVAASSSIPPKLRRRRGGCPMANSPITTITTKQHSSSSFYKALLDSSFDAIVVADVKGMIHNVNDAAVQIFGYASADDMVGQNVSILCGAAHRSRHDVYMRNCWKRTCGDVSQSPAVGHLRDEMAARANGTEFPCRIGIHVVRVQAQGGQEEENTTTSNDDDSSSSNPHDNLMLVGYIRDVTSEKEAQALAMEKRAAEVLLSNVLPTEIAHRLKQQSGTGMDTSHIADHHEAATILFADIVGFTRLSNTLQPIQVVTFLNDIFSRFDACLQKYAGLNKIKTIGDCYMVTNVPVGFESQVDARARCAAVCHFAVDMMGPQ